MNILQAHKFYWHRDGASNYFFTLSEMLRAAGDTVIPFSMEHPENEPSAYAKYFVSHIDLSHPGAVPFGKKIVAVGRMLYSHEAKRHMNTVLSEHPVDLVHLHNIYHHISPSILPVIKKRGIPIVMTLHDYKLVSPNYSLFHHGAVHEEDGRGWYGTCVRNKCMKDSRMQSRIVRYEMIFHHKIMKYYERLVDRFIAPSEFMIDLCVRFGWPREKFVHIPHPVDTRHYTSISSAQEGTSVVYAGRLSEEKGLLVLLRAAAQTPDIPYVLIGSGPQEAVLRQEIETQNLRNVTLTGFLTGESLRHVQKQARLMVLPSIWYENYPLSILEAKAMGKMVIGTNIGGIPELIPDACVVPPGDASTLAARISQWYHATPRERRAYEERGRQEVDRVNHPEQHLAAIKALYRTLV